MQPIAAKTDNASNLTANEWNQVPDELENAITDTGQTLSAGDLFQISRSMANYAAGGASYNESGTANAYVLSPIDTKKGPTAYVDGLTVAFRAGNRNTGSSTININSLGVKNLNREDGSNLSAGDILANEYVVARYYLTGGYFVLIPQARIGYGVDTGSANAYAVALPVSRGALVTGETIRFRATNANTGASTLNLNSIGAVAIRRPDGQPLYSGDIEALHIIDVVYDGTYWILKSPMVDPGFDAIGNCQLTRTNTTTLKLSRYGGRSIPIKTGGVWVKFEIPSAGITVTNAATLIQTGSLAANTSYLIYAYDNAGTLALAIGTLAGGHSADATTGVDTLVSGGVTYTLVGVVHTDSAATTWTTDLQVDSWYHPKPRKAEATFSPSSTASTTPVSVATLPPVVMFSGRSIEVMLRGSMTSSASGTTASMYVYANGSLASGGITGGFNAINQTDPVNLTVIVTPVTDGVVTIEQYGHVTGATTASWSGMSYTIFGGDR